MMPYRVEYSKSGRAGCNGPCKDGKDKQKIEKGALRFGSWVEGNDSVHAFWSWRHWGCVTAKQCVNLASDIGDDFDNLDGYEDMEDDDKAKIRQAIADGQIAEEDMTPGLAEKQAKEEQEKEDKKRAKEQERMEKKQAKEQERKEAQKAKKVEQDSEKRKVKAESSDIDEELEETVPVSKKRSRAKKDDGAEAAPKAKKRAKVKAEKSEEIPAQKSAKSASRKTKVKDEPKNDVEISHKTKKGSKAKSDSFGQKDSDVKPKPKVAAASKNSKKDSAMDGEGSTRSTRRSTRNSKR